MKTISEEIDDLLVESKDNEFKKENNLEEDEYYWWLSFCDDDLPKGSQFLGVVIVRASGGLSAIQKAHELGINPGGEVQFIAYADIDDEVAIANSNKLLSKKELKDRNLLN